MSLCCSISLLQHSPFSPNPFLAPPSPPPSPLLPSRSALLKATGTTSGNPSILSLCNDGRIDEALHALSLEPRPSQATYAALVLACTNHNAFSHARRLHRRISRDGFDQDNFVATKLVDMYSKFGNINNARKVFEKMRTKNIFLWNAFLRALALAGEGEEAVALCSDLCRSEVQLDRFTYSFALKACVVSPSQSSIALRRVREIHCHMLRHGFESVVHIGTTLVDAYSKLSRVMCAKKVFDMMPQRNVYSWSTMIACYANSERSSDALDHFRKMMVEVQPNAVTMVSVLQACAGLSALDLGKLVHAYVLRRGLDSILPVENALLAMYIKCGKLELGRRIFDMLGRKRDIVSWNSMISGLGTYGLGEESVSLFHEMTQLGISPNARSFVSVLGACSHSGLVQHGKELFHSMTISYGIIPRAEHYACFVDLLGRAGHLDEAIRVIEEMPIEPGPNVWGALLGACRIHGNVKLAERACQHLFELEPMNAGNYVLLSNIYADAKMFEEVNMVRKLLWDKNLQKVSGCSWIEVKKKIYSFVSVDEMDPLVEQLNALLVQLVNEMKNDGYVPQINSVLSDLGQEEKERMLLGHSEKLAVAFGLINTSSKDVIRVTKNLRLCEDCHAVTKFISKFTKREIFVRDVNRLHHFSDGVCSCKDYW